MSRMIFVESHIDHGLAGLEKDSSGAVLRWVAPYATHLETRTCRRRGNINLGQAFLVKVDAQGMVRDEQGLCLGYQINAKDALRQDLLCRPHPSASDTDP